MPCTKALIWKLNEGRCGVDNAGEPSHFMTRTSGNPKVGLILPSLTLFYETLSRYFNGYLMADMSVCVFHGVGA
jgi:hypothetical protein